MSRIFSFILKNRVAVVVIFSVAVILSVVGITKTVINPDISSYLTNDSVSKKTMNVLSEYFEVHGDASLVVEGGEEDYNRLKDLSEELGLLKDVRSVLWLGSYAELFEFSDGEIVSSNPFLPDKNVQKLASEYFKEADGKTYWLFNVSLGVSGSGGLAADVLDEIETLLEDYSVQNGGRDYAVGGNAAQSQNMIDSALDELPLFLGVAVVIIAIILLFTSKSVMSAGIFLITIGVSILLNMGTNFLKGSISTVTFSVSAILQLALSMDYSIFLTHAYEKARETDGDKQALITALKKTLIVIAASALTTVAGFAALFAMKFKMGADLGLCLAKGVTFSFLTVIILQPCLMMLLKKACDRTSHKAFTPRLNFLARFSKKSRYFLPVICVLLIVPTLLLAMNLNYYYIDSNFNKKASGAQKISQELGSQTVLVIPKVSDEKQLLFFEAVEGEPMVSGVTGYYALISTLTEGISIPFYSSLEEQNEQTLLFNLELGTSDILSIAAGKSIEEKASGIIGGFPLEIQGVIAAQLAPLSEKLEMFAGMLSEAADSYFADIEDEKYTFVAVTISGEPESDAALATVDSIVQSSESFLGASERLAAGNTQAVSDLKTTTQKDFIVVSALSALLIFLILAMTFRSIFIPLLLVALIELAILLNISITSLMGNQLNFMSYIVISAIQMGATIDYAILYTQNYKSKRLSLSPYGAASEAVKDSALPILVSMSILVCACLSVYFVSSDRIIREITMLISRGAAISATLVLTALPAIFSIKIKRKK